MNKEIFGKWLILMVMDMTKHLELTVSGEASSDTGMITNLEDLDVVVHKVIDELDHKGLMLKLNTYENKSQKHCKTRRG